MVDYPDLGYFEIETLITVEVAQEVVTEVVVEETVEPLAPACTGTEVIFAFTSYKYDYTIGSGP
jgi:hypothetical protein